VRPQRRDGQSGIVRRIFFVNQGVAIMSLLGIQRAAASAVQAFKAASPAIALVATLAAAVIAWHAHEKVKAAPVDPLTTIGRAYVASLGDAYAGAWIEGASALESGKSVADALGVVAGSWQAGRVALFDKTAAPAFSKIVAENTADADVTAQNKSTLAASWRSFAAGLKSPATGK
jgi:hypothetical protein